MSLIYLVEIACLIAGTPSTLRFCSGETGYQTRPTDTPASEPYAPRIGELTWQFDLPGGERVDGSGRLAIRNLDGLYDDLLDYVYDSQSIKLYLVEDDAAYTSAKELCRWVVEQPSDDGGSIGFVFHLPTYNLDKPLQTVRYGGTGGIDGGSELTNKPKPLVWGRTLNAKGVLVDSTKLIYQLTSAHDITDTAIAAGQIGADDASSLTVYVAGEAATRGADYTNVADMLANAPTGGDDYRICNATASGSGNNYGVYARFQSDPLGPSGDAAEVTFACLSRPTTSVSTFSIINWLLLIASGLDAALHGDDATAVNTTFPYVLDLAYGSDGEPATHLDALRTILGGMRGWIVPYQGVPTQFGTSLDPPWAVRWLDAPATATPSPYQNDLLGAFGSVSPYITIDGSQVAMDSGRMAFKRRALYEYGWPEYQVTLLYDRIDHLQTTGIAGAVGIAQRTRLGLEYLSASDDDASVLTSFPTAADRTVTTAWTSASGTIGNEATRQLGVFSEHHPTYELRGRADLYHAVLTVPGDPMDVVNCAKHGCDVLRTFLILGLGIDFLSYDEGDNTVGVTLTLWG